MLREVKGQDQQGLLARLERKGQQAIKGQQAAKGQLASRGGVAKWAMRVLPARLARLALKVPQAQ